ncbi:putative RNA-binding protein C25G10.01 [Cladobotryum mycophilum]|uniref:RNA-binding protein C25G10.01 n=1 Tax=Cladobotryum mycophilum TaxID=491253 RepID=A0ABR0SUG7_9HYPO
MATTAMDYEAANGDRYDDEAPRYERDNRSASPRPLRDDTGSRRRSASPTGNADIGSKDASGPKDDDDGAINPGSNLFVTGIHPRLTEAEVSKMFEKYGEVEKCQIMRDPHTKESRGFGFVKMVTSEQAEAAREGLQGEVVEGRTMSIEKARRARPRTPTPGKYFGPPKRDHRPRFDDRRRGGYSGGSGTGGSGGGSGSAYGRDDSYRYRGNDRGYDRNYDRGYERRYEDRTYERGYREERRYEDRGYGRDYERGYERRDRDENYGRERYASGREDRDRYGARGGASGGGGGSGAGGGGAGGGSGSGSGYERGDRYDRPSDREAGRPREPAAGGGPAYGESASRSEPREQYGGPDTAMH